MTFCNGTLERKNTDISYLYSNERALQEVEMRKFFRHTPQMSVETEVIACPEDAARQKLQCANTWYARFTGFSAKAQSIEQGSPPNAERNSPGNL
jgi:hypothetical protein